MPMLVVAVVALLTPEILAAIGATAAIAAATGLSAGVIGAIAGLVVSAVGTFIVAAIQKGSDSKGSASRTAAQQDARQMIRSPIEARRVIYGTARVSGPLIYAASSGADSRFLHLVIPLAAHPVQAIDHVWLGDSIIPPEHINADGVVIAGPYAGWVRIRKYLGNQTTADPYLMAESPDGWSATDVMAGIPYIYVRLEYQETLFRSGIPNVSAAVIGKNDIIDPRTGTAGFSNNWALCVRDYLLSDFGLACAADEIDDDYFIAAANLADEQVQLDAAGTTTQARYIVDGSFKTDRAPIDIIDELMSAGQGALVYVQGKYRLHGGAYESPTDTITVSDLAGDIEITTKPSRKDLFNTARGNFIDPGKGWQASQFPTVVNSSFRAEDGEEIAKDLDFPYCIDPTRAQRLATLQLRKSRPLTARMPLRYACLRLAVWQMVSVTIADLGWNAKPFRILGWTFAPETGIVTATIQEEQPSYYAWTWDTAALPPDFPDTTLVDPLSLPGPAGLSLTEQVYVTMQGGGLKQRIVATWAPVPNPFVTEHEMQFRNLADGIWRDGGAARIGSTATIDDLAEGRYEVRVRARSSVAIGEWATATIQVGLLISSPPAAVSGLGMQVTGGLAWLRWTQHTDLDVLVGGRIEFRHSPLTTGATWNDATSIGDAVPGSATFTALPLKSGTYLAKAVDDGGRYATDAASVTTAQVSVLTYSSLGTVTEDTGFSGTKTSTVAVSSTLRLDTGTSIDSVSDFDAIVDLDALGGVLPEGSYAFNTGIDLTTVKNCRLQSHVKAAVNNLLDQVDARSGAIDDWINFDGMMAGDADAWVEVRQTDDNPAGSPTWSGWSRLDAGEYRARAFQFRAQLRSADANFNIHISELRVFADEVT